MSGKNTRPACGLIVLSGGMDSVTLLYEYQPEISVALTFDYGSKHNAKEIACAKYHANMLGIEHIVIPLSFMHQYFSSALLIGGDAIPKGAYDLDNMAKTVVPFRNGIMLSIAAGLAESKGFSKIFIANHFGDHAIYPDCRTSFIEPMKGAILNGTGNQVELCAPYTNLSKTDIAKIGKQLNLDYSTTWSCYCGGDVHCGECATCQERIEAIKGAEINDATIYANKK